MAEITVWGSIPVAVVVDTDAGEVLSVHAMDEQFERSGVAYTAGGIRIGGPASAKAEAIVDGAEACWPSWEWGW